MDDDYTTALADAERLLDEVDAALARLEEGRYGTCEVCGQPIDEGRLGEFPVARTCGNHPQLTDPKDTGPAA